MAASSSELSREVTLDFLAEQREAFLANPQAVLAANVMTSTDPDDVMSSHVALRRDGDAHVFSHVVTKENKAANQKSSGRCWLFAFLNVVRRDLVLEHGLNSDFELSQNHLFFWDKIERANYFLENVIKTLGEDTDSRIVHHLMSDPINDGGQWDMIVNLVNKYGLVPKECYPEAWSATASRKMNAMLKAMLREYASVLRAQGSGPTEGMTFAEIAERGNKVRQLKKGMMEDIYRMVVTHLGVPVTKFDWKVESKDKETGKKTVRRCVGLTPLTFVEQFVKFDVNEYVSLINDPRNAYGATYTVEYLGNVVGGKPVLYLNAPVDVLKAAVEAKIRDDTPVWFGCDVGKYFHRKSGVLDTAAFDPELVFGVAPSMDKATRLRYGQSLMTHAMVFTGFDDVSGALRVENSWGSKDRPADGYLSMSADWFNEFVYQVVVKKSDLPDDLVAVLDSEPVVLPAWDPMGALA